MKKMLPTTLVVLLALNACALRCASKPIEQSLANIEKKVPAVAQELPTQTKKFEQVIDTFLDINNNESYLQHVARLEKNITELEQLFNQYNVSTSSAKKLIRDLKELIAKLKSLGSKPNSLALASTLQSYGHLIPQSIYDKYPSQNQILQVLKKRVACNSNNPTQSA